MSTGVAGWIRKSRIPKFLTQEMDGTLEARNDDGKRRERRIVMLEIKADLRQQQYDDLRWARRSRQLQEEYAGQVVVLHKRKVIAHGYDEGILVDQLTSEGYPRDELVIVEVLSHGFELPPEFA